MLAYISLWANTGLCHNLTFGLLVSSYRSLFSAGCFTPAVGPSFWLVRWGWWWVERKRTFVARAFAVGSIWEIDDWCGSGAQSISPIGWRSPFRSFVPMLMHKRAREFISISSPDVCRRCSLRFRCLPRWSLAAPFSATDCKLGGICFCLLIPLL